MKVNIPISIANEEHTLSIEERINDEGTSTIKISADGTEVFNIHFRNLGYLDEKGITLNLLSKKLEDLKEYMRRGYFLDETIQNDDDYSYDHATYRCY